MQVIGEIMQAFFEQLEIRPEEISEMEIVPEGLPGEWWIHVQPEQSWFAQVSYWQGKWWVVVHDYL